MARECLKDYDIVFDDDSSEEAADMVCMKMDEPAYTLEMSVNPTDGDSFQGMILFFVPPCLEIGKGGLECEARIWEFGLAGKASGIFGNLIAELKGMPPRD